MAPRFAYTQEQMEKAIAAVRGGMSVRAASVAFKVPRATLFDKIKGKTQLDRKMGRDPYLSQEEESQIVE